MDQEENHETALPPQPTETSEVTDRTSGQANSLNSGKKWAPAPNSPKPPRSIFYNFSLFWREEEEVSSNSLNNQSSSAEREECSCRGNVNDITVPTLSEQDSEPNQMAETDPSEGSEAVVSNITDGKRRVSSQRASYLTNNSSFRKRSDEWLPIFLRKSRYHTKHNSFAFLGKSCAKKYRTMSASSCENEPIFKLRPKFVGLLGRRSSASAKAKFLAAEEASESTESSVYKAVRMEGGGIRGDFSSSSFKTECKKFQWVDQSTVYNFLFHLQRADFKDPRPMEETGFLDLALKPLLLASYLGSPLKKCTPCPPQLADDFVVLAGDERIICELAVLQCYSEIFIPYQKNTVYVLHQSITAEAFKLIYCWMTTDDMQIMTDDIVKMLNATDKLKVTELKAALSWLIADLAPIGEDYTFCMYLEARTFGLPQFNFALLNCRKFFLTLVATKDFVMLSEVELYRLLSSSEICVNTEAEVLMAAVRWLIHDWTNRKFLLRDVMVSIRVALLPVTFIHDVLCGFSDSVLNMFGKQPAIVKALQKGLKRSAKPRNWIYDPNCRYHVRVYPTKNDRSYKFKSFKKYLKFLKAQEPGYFKELEPISASDSEGGDSSVDD